MSKYTQKDLDKRFESKRGSLVAKCRFLTPFCGGQPADEKGLRAFIVHHLGLQEDTPEFDKAFARINDEEIGERDLTPGEGEIKEEEVYAINVIRQDDVGPYLMAHQIQALLKQAASRLDLYTAKKGSKGDMAEMGSVFAHGESNQSDDRRKVYLRNGEGKAETYFEIERGCVTSSQGRKSIMTHVEHAPIGTHFEFEFRWLPRKNNVSEDVMVTVMGGATAVGLGSVLSLGHGSFEVLEMEVVVPKWEPLKKPDK